MYRAPGNSWAPFTHKNPFEDFILDETPNPCLAGGHDFSRSFVRVQLQALMKIFHAFVPFVCRAGKSFLVRVPV
jgi:hypothetical protein